jgi:hypothetical protein
VQRGVEQRQRSRSSWGWRSALTCSACYRDLGLMIMRSMVNARLLRGRESGTHFITK